MKLLLYLSVLLLFISSCTQNNNQATGFVEVNGANLWYEVIGNGEPIVFIHGNFGDHRHWDFQVEALSDNFKVIRYDVRGYGKSSFPDSIQTYRDCDDLKAILDYLAIKEAHVCGVSMGSGIAIDFVLEYPEYCKSVIPIGPWASGYGGGKYRTEASDSMFYIMRKTTGVLSTEGPKAATDYWWTGDHEIKNTVIEERTLDSLLRMGYEYSWWGFLNRTGQIAISPAGVERLSEIAVPTLIITAEYDIQACKEIAELMHKEIRNSEVVSIEEAGHLMNMDNPEEFNKVISEFISNKE